MINIAGSVNQNLRHTLNVKARGLLIREVSGVVIQITLAPTVRGVVKSVPDTAMIGVNM